MCLFVVAGVRLYPVGITVQRMPVKDIVLQNYHVPAGVSFFQILPKSEIIHS